MSNERPPGELRLSRDEEYTAKLRAQAEFTELRARVEAAGNERGIHELRAANRGLTQQLSELRREYVRVAQALRDKTDPEDCNTGPDVRAELKGRLRELNQEYEELNDECEAWKTRAEEAEALAEALLNPSEPGKVETK